MDPIRVSPYGPAASDTTGCTNRPDRRQHLTTGTEPFEEMLALSGASIDGHTTVPDQAATDSVLKPDLPTRGRPHTPFVVVFPLFQYCQFRYRLTARSADRAVPVELRRFITMNHVI